MTGNTGSLLPHPTKATWLVHRSLLIVNKNFSGEWKVFRWYICQSEKGVQCRKCQAARHLPIILFPHPTKAACTTQMITDCELEFIKGVLKIFQWYICNSRKASNIESAKSSQTPTTYQLPAITKAAWILIYWLWITIQKVPVDTKFDIGLQFCIFWETSCTLEGLR